ncbi:MAG: anaerobic ribonucleoside-triphosphate reductase activating protein [Anaerovoracaceae bacterium]
MEEDSILEKASDKISLRIVNLENNMNYATIKTNDISNGPGIRVSLYVSGCTHHCRECFNPETWDFDYGKKFDDVTTEFIIEAMSPEYVKGFSLLGGEPFEPENQPVLALLLEKLRKRYPEKSVWCYTGYLFDRDIVAHRLGDSETTDRLLNCIDVIVDGEFQIENKVLDLRFRGSTNQRIIDVKASLITNEVVLWKDDF